jgi:hypothetical protein
MKIIESMKKDSKKMLKIIPINNSISLTSEKGKKNLSFLFIYYSYMI